LFAKIFLGFWLTTIAVVIATAVATNQLNRSRRDDPMARHFERTQSAYAAAAEAILDTGGLDELSQWMHELQGPGGARGRLQLLDDDGSALFGPPAAADITAALAALGSGAVSPQPRDRVFVAPLYSPDGERYWFVSDMRRSRMLPPAGLGLVRRGWHPPGLGGSRLAVAVLVSGIVCFWLARYLTTPIRRLQSASAEIANGNFKVRVGHDRRRDELGDLGRDFDRMAERLERLQASQQQLLRDVSHELRSPLARLQVALGLARQRGGEAIAAQLDRIEREAEALEELIAELLSVARIESGGPDRSDTDVAIDALLETVVRDASFEGSDDGKTVRLTDTVSATVRGDSAILKSALENVVRNALKHTPAGTAVEVSMRRDANPERVSIRVRDHGPGVAPNLIDDLFKPFVRAEYARGRDTGGYGIGLAIADAAIKRHRGTISARNHESGGFCVDITLPAVS